MPLARSDKHQRVSFVKDPAAVLDYAFDWTDWLATDETIAQSAWTVPTGLTKVSDTVSGNSTIIWLSGGTAGSFYPVTCRMTTNATRVEERTFVVEVTDT